MYQNILILPDGTEAQIRSLTLRQLVNAGTDLTLGSACCDMLEATVFAQELQLDPGADIALYREAAGVRTLAGIYTPEAPTRLTEHTWRITAYDHMARLDKDLTPWLRSLTGWPYGVQAFAQMVCESCGVSYKWSEELPNKEFLIPKWSASAVTGRKILSWLGELTCRFVHATSNGSIGFSWYEDRGKILTHTGDSYYLGGSLRYQGYRIAPIEAVQLRRISGLFPQVSAGANSYILTGNPILEACSEETLAPVLQTIRETLQAVSYHPGSVAAVSDPNVSAGDILHIVDAAGREVTLYIMEKTTASRRDTYTATGNPRRDSVTALHSKTAAQKEAETALQTEARLTKDAIFAGLPGGIRWANGCAWLDPAYLLPGEITADIKLFPGGALVVDALPEESEPGRLYLLRTEAIPGYAALQPYLGEERKQL